MREHSRQKPDGFWESVRCIADYDSCPVCAIPDNRPFDVVLLTVLDLTPWSKFDPKTNKQVTYEYTKRVIALKKNDYAGMQTIASTQGMNLRGVMLDMTRGHDTKESACGKPVFIKKLTEDELIEAFGSPEKVYESGFVLPANNALTIVNYKEIYKVPTRDELAIGLGLGPRPGSRAEAQDDSPPWDELEVETLDLSEDLPDVD